jgi:hypothetical protein
MGGTRWFFQGTAPQGERLSRRYGNDSVNADYPPPELRNPGEEALLPQAAEMKGGTIQAEEVGRRVVRAIERNDLYILTHPEQRDFLRRRAAKLDAMFAPEVW